jgi:hypothetical protein
LRPADRSKRAAHKYNKGYDKDDAMRASFVIAGGSAMISISTWWHGKLAPLLDYTQNTADQIRDYALSCLLSAGLNNCPDLWPVGLGYANIYATFVFYVALAVFLCGLWIGGGDTPVPPGYNG